MLGLSVSYGLFFSQLFRSLRRIMTGNGIYIGGGGEGGRQTDRKRDKQTNKDRQTDTDRQTERERTQLENFILQGL